jgi:hypothetical protein
MGPQGIQGPDRPDWSTGAFKAQSDRRDRRASSDPQAAGNTGTHRSPGIQGPIGPQGPQGIIGPLVRRAYRDPSAPRAFKAHSAGSGHHRPTVRRDIQVPPVPGETGATGPNRPAGTRPRPDATDRQPPKASRSDGRQVRRPTGPEARQAPEGPTGPEGPTVPEGADSYRRPDRPRRPDGPRPDRPEGQQVLKPTGPCRI